MAWINAAALWGLTLIAIPIAIHLLVRQQTRLVLYPSLRFVRETALAAFRRRAIQDAALLACRAAIVIAAVLALAGPILQSAARTTGHAGRVSRAIVQLDATPIDPQLAAGAFRAQVFHRAGTADAAIDAVRWLDAQPPSSREIVFAGAFRKGQITKSDLQSVPIDIGVRFAPGVSPEANGLFTHVTLRQQDGRLVFARTSVRLSSESTHVEPHDEIGAPDNLIRVVAAAKDQALADAALSAVLDAGVRWPDPDRRLVVYWLGAEITAPSASNADVVRMVVPTPPATAATALRDAIDAVMPDDATEVVAIAAEDLDAWSRPAGPVSPNAPPADEGDRRWLWALAVILLALEHWLRRDGAQLANPQQERRAA